MNAEPAAIPSNAPRRPTVAVGGITWEIHSRNERSATVNGRHVFAARCRSGRPWSLLETDRPMQTGARVIDRHGECATHELSSRATNLPPRPDFYRLNEAPRYMFGRAVLEIVSPGGLIEATFYGEDKRDAAVALTETLNRRRNER